MDDLDCERIALEPAAEFFGNRDTAMLSAGAADGQRQVALAFALVTAADQVDEFDVPVEELCRALL
jgi:hypothetical protein